MLDNFDPTTIQDPVLLQLSIRERAVLELVAQRVTNKEIAPLLNLSEYTLKNHLRNILAKLYVRNQAEAANMLLNSIHGTGK